MGTTTAARPGHNREAAKRDGLAAIQALARDHRRRKGATWKAAALLALAAAYPLDDFPTKRRRLVRLAEAADRCAFVHPGKGVCCEPTIIVYGERP